MTLQVSDAFIVKVQSVPAILGRSSHKRLTSFEPHGLKGIIPTLGMQV